MKGCMSEVLRSSFSYQVAEGSTMSEYRQVVDMRKSSVTSRSSLPSAPLSCHTTSFGLASPSSPRSGPSTAFCVPSRYLRKYSWPLPEEPRRLERHTNRLRGKFFGLSGSSQENLSAPLLICSTAYLIGSMPAASAARVISSGLVSSWGAEGSQPNRSARTLKSIRRYSAFFLSAIGDRISVAANNTRRLCLVWA